MSAAVSLEQDYARHISREERALRDELRQAQRERDRSERKLRMMEQEVENVEAAVRSMRATIDAESLEIRGGDDRASLPDGD